MLKTFFLAGASIVFITVPAILIWHLLFDSSPESFQTALTAAALLFMGGAAAFVRIFLS